MKTAKISATPSRMPAGFGWTWRCDADDTTSATPFTFYFDCLTDARNHGYDVVLTQAHGMTAPSGPRYTLHRMDD